MLNNEKMKAKCVAWIEQGLGECRAPITYDELNYLLNTIEEQKAIIKRTEQRLYARENM